MLLPLAVSEATYYPLLFKMFSYLDYYLTLTLVGSCQTWITLSACGLVLALKPPKVQWFEVSHLLVLIALCSAVERPLIPAWMRRKTGDGMQIVKSQC